MATKTPADRIVRVPDLTDAEWRELRVTAAERGISVGALVALALQTAPATRKVFK